MELSDVGGGIEDVTADPNSPYYIGPIGHDTTSGDEIRAEVTRQVDDEIAKGWLGDVVTPLFRDETIQRRYEQRIVQIRDQVDDGVEIRDNGTAPSSVWDNASHAQMLQVINDNADSAAIAVTSEEWVRLGKDLTEHQQNLADAINASVADWQGDGGDAARKHLADVGQWLGNTAKGATLTGRQQEIHSQALNETQKQMAANPPVNFDVQAANAHLQTITDPVVYAQQAQLDQQAMQQSEVARQQAARIMTQYDETVAGATLTPAFTAPPKLGGTRAQTATLSKAQAMRSEAGIPDTAAGAQQAANLRSVATPAAQGTPVGTGDVNSALAANLDSPSLPQGEVPGLDTAGSGAGANTPALNTYGADTGSGDYGTVGSQVPGLSTPDYPAGSPTTFGGGTLQDHSSVPDLDIPDSTVASSAVDPSSSGGSSTRIPTIGYGGGVNGDSIASRLGGPAVSGNPLTGLDSVTGSGTPLGGGSTTGAKGLGGAGGGGAGAPALKSFGGGAGGGGLGGAGGTNAGRLSGGASSGAAALAAEEAAAGRGATGAAGAAGAAGRAGMPAAGMGGAHGAKGQGAEDKEHRVADYIEGEPELFEGADVVAPPVIGDWKKNKKEEKK